MKKLVAISILLTLLTAAAFAQFKVQVVGDFYPSLLKVTAPIGDATDKSRDPSLATGDTATTGPDGNIYKGVGTFDLLSIDTGADWSYWSNELRLTLSYTGKDDRYGAMMQVWGDDLVNRGSGFAFAENQGRGLNIQDILDQRFHHWNIWGKVGNFKGYLGTEEDRGVLGYAYEAAFNNFFSWTILANNQGILMRPGNNNIIDVNNILAAPVANQNGLQQRPYFAVTADFAPISVTLAGDLSNVMTPDVADQSYNRVGVAIRASGKKIADLVSFDAIYKLHGGDADTEDKLVDNSQPDGEGIWGHTFGLFAGVDVLSTLNIGLGYSGYTHTRERDETQANSIVYQFPYYNGIDLRVQFTGVDKLTVSFINNISFATMTGDDDDYTQRYGLWSDQAGATLNTGIPGQLDDSAQTQGYLALHNALGVKYQITDALYASFQIANWLYSYTDTSKARTGTQHTSDFIETIGEDEFRAGLSAGYAFGSNVLFETGLLFGLHSYSLNFTDGGNANYDYGKFTFGIPIRFKVAF